MTLKKFQAEHYEEVVDMFYSFIKETVSNRGVNPKYFFYRAVGEWIKSGCDIVVAIDKNTPVGFSMCKTSDFDGLTDEFYLCEYCFVKEHKRGSRAAYMLYKNAYNFAKENNLTISTNGRIENGVSEMITKHFGLKPKYILMED